MRVIKRGAPQDLWFELIGDYTTSTLYFTLTDSQKADATRIAEVACTSELVGTNTFVKATLTALHTSGRDNKYYFSDIRDDDNRLLHQEVFHIIKGSRDQYNEVTGTMFGSYKRYIAVLSQTGASAPTATILENTLGVTPTLARTSTGIYTITAADKFTANKTWIAEPQIKIAVNGNEAQANLYRTDASTLELKVWTNVYDLTDAWNDLQVEIRVFT